MILVTLVLIFFFMPSGAALRGIGRLDLSKTDAGFEVLSYIASETAGPYSPYMRLLFAVAE